MNSFDENRTIYEIPAENYTKFEMQVAKLSKRAVKLGLEEIKPFVFDRENKKLEDGEMHRVYKVFFNVDSPRLDGWRFAATLDHSQETGNIVRAVPNTGLTIPERFRTVDSHCEHCRVRRYRRDTFIVCHEETEEYKQVGSTCLADFMGHDAYKLARMAEFLSYAAECGRGAEQFVGGDLRYIEMESYLTHAACIVRNFGWVSGRAAWESGDTLRSTKERAFRNMFPRYEAPLKATDEDKALALEALEWARGFQTKANLSDYESNVLVIAKAEMIEPRSMGIAASIVGVYLMHKAREAERAARAAENAANTASQHVGQVDERMCFGPCLLVRATSKENEWGRTYIYTFKTAEGNVLKWFSSKPMGIVAGETHILVGTVKKHGEFNNVKDTTVTRCTLGAPKSAARKKAA